MHCSSPLHLSLTKDDSKRYGIWKSSGYLFWHLRFTSDSELEESWIEKRTHVLKLYSQIWRKPIQPAVVYNVLIVSISHGTFYLVRRFNFWVCEQNSIEWPFKMWGSSLGSREGKCIHPGACDWISFLVLRPSLL